MSLTVRRKGGGFYVIDDGNQMLDACPCCGKPLTETAARRVITSIEGGKMTFTGACILLELAKATQP